MDPASAIGQASQRFAQLRETFHRLLELDLAAREQALRRIELEQEAFGAQLRALLARLDEADLLAPATASVPTRAGPFRLLRKLGRGGMGEVWLAERVEGGFEQQVALKRVRDAALSPDMTRRFLRERQILARLVHPNIAHLVDGGFAEDGRPWLAMEYVQGQSITEWCAERGLDSAARVRLLLPLCDAVQFAHRNLIVHRDLKPANLMVDSEGRPKMLDFGIARLLEGDVGDPTQTMLAMTPAYAAPEQRSGGAITTAVDVYQLGIVLFELIGGARPKPIGASAGPDIPGEIARSAVAPLHGDLGRIVLKATAAAPGDRYASVSMLAEDLSDWLAQRPLRSGIGSRRLRMRRTLWQWRWPLAMLAVLLLAIGGGALLALREAQVARARAAEARASFEALLGVLGSVNTGRYAGREPLAAELLVDAAARLQRDFRHDPALLREALGEIGHGLVNLGRRREAEPILAAALDALRREAVPQPARELGLLKLLAFAQEESEARGRARVTADRIAHVATRPGVSPGLAMDVLASAARGQAFAGNFERAHALLAQAEPLAVAGVNIAAAQRENFWRQRGWIALHGMNLGEARRALAQSRAVQDSAPGEFSPVRRAELDLMLAETALADADAAGAVLALAAAKPALLVEYPAGHLEHAHLQLQEARLALLQGEHVRALSLAQTAHAVLQASGGESSGRALAERVLRVAQARNGACNAGRATPEHGVGGSAPLDRAERDWMDTEVQRACGSHERNGG